MKHISLKNKLAKFKKHMVREHETTKQEALHVPEQKLSENKAVFPYKDEWKKQHAEAFVFENEYCIVRRIVYPLSFQHGNYPLNALPNVVEEWNKSTLKHPLSCKGHEVRDLFFFDTETTGLGGGAGNTIFLLGQAQVLEDQVVVTQHLLPKPGNEVALYQSFLNQINLKTLVTYNGKAFDWPQVKSRHTLIRNSVPHLPDFGHFDLYHASRRLWKHHLDSVKLAIVEKEILNVNREEDVPGYLAPMLYFQFLQQESPEILTGVLRHNEIDVLSLITLYIHLSKKILNRKDIDDEEEQYEMSRWLMGLKAEKDAYELFEEVSSRSGRMRNKSNLQIANFLKRKGEFQQAARLWRDVFEKSKGMSKFKAGIELAKFYEHREKDLNQALKVVREMLMTIKEQKRNENTHEDKIELDLLKRELRLEGKLTKKYSPGKRKS
ncbi:ribonuclease H-like domain-containing protein [Metabacillus arenae]|uniref:ribonuclease H-like domain-containing protein n=1 Tax=Metabacillus arenae TaxID=2771434 RepID=UPI00296545E6|nr:ribonuclease H-like domain-containing protein [Metabacillus arenae]